MILLLDLEGMSMPLKVPVGTVCSRLLRGRETLRRLMDVREQADVNRGIPSYKVALSKYRRALVSRDGGFPGHTGAQLDAACRVRLGAPVWGEGWDRKWDSSEPRQPDCVEKL